jgi:hypothetical protein
MANTPSEAEREEARWVDFTKRWAACQATSGAYCVVRIPYFVSGKGRLDFDFVEYEIRITLYASASGQPPAPM